MPKFDVLDPLHEIVQPHFLEASAGTGKTFSIEHIVARLFLDQKADLDPASILIVTFTRASTRDLKVRIRENLSHVYHVLKEKKPTPFRYLEPYLQEEKLRIAAIKRLENILACFDEIEIFTIHGFCSKMLKEYPFEAKIGFSADSQDTLSVSALHKEVVLDVFRAAVDNKHFHIVQMQKLLNFFSQDLDKLVTNLSKLIQQQISIEPPKTFDQVQQDFYEIIEANKKNYIASSFEEEFTKVASHFKGLANQKKEFHVRFWKQVKLFEEVFLEKINPKELLEKLLKEEDCFFEQLIEENFKKNAKTSFSCLIKENKILDLSQKLSDLFYYALHSSRILLHVAFLCKKALEKVTGEKGIISPDYFLTMMQKKLSCEPFLEKVRNRYKAALIDEFQDTDPVQWAIFEKLFIENREGFPLYLVGDPKQSIYAFRNADLPTYLKAKNIFKENQRFTLNTNYRSEPQLIEALNALFSLSKTWLCDKGLLEYEKVNYSPFAKNTQWLDGKKALHFFIAEDNEKRNFSMALKSAEEKVFFPFIAQEINHLIYQGFSYEDMAILVRDRFQGDRLERFLKSQKIPYTATARVALKDSSSFTFFKLLIEILGKKQLGLIKQLFAHPIMGFSHYELKTKELDSSFVFGLQALKKLISIYEESGFLRFWRFFLQTRFKPEGMIFEKDLLSQGQSQEYFDLVQIADLLIEKHQKQYISYQELIGILAEIEQTDPEEDPRVCRRPQCDSSAVIVMTIHKSKGLEFKFVFALGACVRGKDHVDIIKSKKQQETFLQVFDVSNQDHQNALYQEDLEKMRHLYVALTRAKQRLYVPYLFYEDSKEKCLSPLELFFKKSFSEDGIFNKELCLEKIGALVDKEISYSLGPPQTPVSFIAIQQGSLEIKKPSKFPKHFKQVFVESFSSLGSKDFVKDAAKASIIKEGMMPSSAEVGEIFHKILEKIFERGLYLHKNKEAIAALIKQEVAYSCLKDFEMQVLELVERVLSVSFSFGELSFCFKDIPLSSIATEMEFLLQDQEQLLTGVIDLFFTFQGKYFLVDWKTNFLGDDLSSYEMPNLEKCMQEHRYDLQASLYIKAAKAFLAKKGLNPEAFGGMMYIFVRGLDPDGRGVVICH